MKKIDGKYKGLTFVEMLVAIGIFVMGVTGFTILFAKSWEINSFIYETGQDSLIASRGVNSLVANLRIIRQAENGDYPIKSADDFDLVVYADIDSDTDSEKIHYFLDQDTGELKRGVSEPSGSAPPTYSSGDDAVTVISKHIVNDSDQPIFSYFGNNYLSDPTPLDTPVTSGSLDEIKIIKINFLVDIRPYHSPDDINIESFVQLRNLKAYEQ